MIEGILETALYADDLNAAEGFYEGVLGLEKITRLADRHVFFRCGPGVLLIFNPAETMKPPAPDAVLPVPPHGMTGQGHACFRVSKENMDGMAAKLAAAMPSRRIFTGRTAAVRFISATLRATAWNLPRPSSGA